MRVLKLLFLLFFLLVCYDRLLSNSSGFSQSAETALSTPTTLNASDSAYSNKVGLSWDAIRNATSYRIFRNTSNDSASAVDIGSTAAATFFDTTCTPNQTYFYWVRAENGTLLSSLSVPDTGVRATGQQGLPLNPPPAPPGNQVTAAKAYLGKALFWDEQLSSTQTVACGTCHIAGNGGSDPRTIPGSLRATNPGADNIFGTADDIYASPGVPANNADGKYSLSPIYGFNEQVTARRSVSFIDAGYSPSLFWDGRATQTFTDPISGTVVLQGGAALESQVLAPPVNTSEMGHAGRNWSDVAARVSQAKPLALAQNIPAALQTWIDNRSYTELFAEAFGTTEVTATRIAMAIATYERTLYSDRTPFDAMVSGISPLTAAEQRGLGVFNQSRCNACHSGALFTDNNFQYTGVRPTNEDTGRFQVTGNQNQLGEFRTPSLRNIELRAPYMHNGRFATLEDVVEFYNRGGDFDAPNKNRNVRPLNLSVQQKADLVAFLKRPLTDPRVAAQTFPFDRPTLYTESSRVPQIIGSGVTGSVGTVPQITAIEPALAGNPSFTVGVHNAPGNARAVLIVDSNEPAASSIVPVTASFARIELQLSGTGQGNGFGSVCLPIPNNNPSLIGATLFGRWYIFDANAPGGVSVTPAFRINIFGVATGDPLPSVKITGAIVSGKNLFVAGTGFERGDIIEINGQPTIATKFVESISLNVKKGVKLLSGCDPANPGKTNQIRLIRMRNSSPVIMDTKILPACP
jgi:cytochrome c peroxidase